ncbi:AMP-binding protein [Aestuariirhabdus litorea]|uniref:Long-chain acyl-CoA synthetase n=1 Tax=Aestuariirhabdus litorea TaxID=2528527 RepID=A0A3P3VTD5_9GAMM|nr:AMP-binding protein [Aestuariirhabdus litorea]RRJ84023.1 long-chain acyl-CoA synthetase [Aestuariirhabdus litorea]RWW97243.1 long-chain acyl-CoA synthetase [Endozoicomonadaceae bacterium GTF-13]
MQSLFQQIEQHAFDTPWRTALEGSQESLSYAELQQAIELLAEQLRGTGCRHLGLMLENGPRWLVWQLAAWKAGMVVVPIPLFFTRQQIRYQLDRCGIELLVGGEAAGVQALDPDFEAGCLIAETGGEETWVRRVAPVALPQGTLLVTFTSGTTGEPKGVCLGAEQLTALCDALWSVVGDQGIERHLSLLPLPVLLENIAGCLMALRAGACCVIPDACESGLRGSAMPDLASLAACLQRRQPDSLILVPELLRALLWSVTLGGYQPSLKFVAVGGGVIGRPVLEMAEQLGLPVYQGYGLSECGSVVALNRPGCNRPATVGKPLAHCRVSLAADGEILIEGNTMLGYVGEVSPACGPVKTGDLGRFDEAGALIINGRKKNLFINSYGRNFSPEWVEAELCASPLVAQVCLVGDGRPFNLALVTPMNGVSQAGLDQWLRTLNRSLPDYARVRECILTREPFSAANGLLTPNGRLRRAQIEASYGDEIEACFCSEVAL